jgi:hypothetical protein
LALPTQPGTTTAILPPLPIELERARGDRLRLCTEAKTITVTDPTTSESEPKPHKNPDPLPQREPWLAMRAALYTVLAAMVVAALLVVLWKRRNKTKKALQSDMPKLPPWEYALQELRILENAVAHEQQRLRTVDRASDVVRQYLGSRFSFDGLGSTSEEVQSQLRALSLGNDLQADVRSFLDATDLVKFAAETTSKQECLLALLLGTRIIQATTPHHALEALDSSAAKAADREPAS